MPLQVLCCVSQSQTSVVTDAQEAGAGVLVASLKRYNTRFG